MTSGAGGRAPRFRVPALGRAGVAPREARGAPPLPREANVPPVADPRSLAAILCHEVAHAYRERHGHQYETHSYPSRRAGRLARRRPETHLEIPRHEPARLLRRQLERREVWALLGIGKTSPAPSAARRSSTRSSPSPEDVRDLRRLESSFFGNRRRARRGGGRASSSVPRRRPPRRCREGATRCGRSRVFRSPSAKSSREQRRAGQRARLPSSAPLYLRFRFVAARRSTRYSEADSRTMEPRSRRSAS